MSEVFSFAEESCWNADKFRPVRKEVVFTVVSTGKVQGLRLKHTLVADYAVFYDPEDLYLIERLSDMEPLVNWGQLVFVRRMDMSGLEIIDPTSDKVVAKITVRRSRLTPTSEDLSGDVGERRVISLDEYRQARVVSDAA